MTRVAIDHDDADARVQPWIRGHTELPPIAPEEASANLSLLEAQLNREMRCFAGRGKVYLQSLVGTGGASKPRIALKCPLRRARGLPCDLYYEFIRDTCCGDPSRCEVLQKFMADHDV
ncbi:MAG: hypothetical protein AMXMBFR13_27790 [Phycisphaerae bacterium]